MFLGDLQGLERSNKDTFEASQNLHLVFLQHLHGLADLVAAAHDGVEKQHTSIGNVTWKLGKDDPSIMRLGIGVDQNFSNPHRPTALLQRLFHGLTRSDDGHATIAPLELESLILAIGRRDHLNLDLI